MMLCTKENVVTRVALEFLNGVIPIFEMFLLLFKKVVQLCIFSVIGYVTFLSNSSGSLRNYKIWKTGNRSHLTCIDCIKLNLQLPDKEIVIGERLRKALSGLTPDQQKSALHGM